MLTFGCSSTQNVVDDEYANLNRLIKISDIEWAEDFTSVSFRLTNESQYLHYPLVVIEVNYSDGTRILGNEELRIYPDPILAPGANQQFTREINPSPEVISATQGVRSSWALKPSEVDKFDKMVRTGSGY